MVYNNFDQESKNYSNLNLYLKKYFKYFNISNISILQKTIYDPEINFRMIIEMELFCYHNFIYNYNIY
jgi:hypothetical protein